MSFYFLLALLISILALGLYKAWRLWGPSCCRISPPDFSSEKSASLVQYERDLEFGLPLLGVLATTSPFIGLSITIIHIMEALKQLPQVGKDIGALAVPLADALNATLYGIACAILALFFYNLCRAKANRMAREAREEKAALKE